MHSLKPFKALLELLNRNILSMWIDCYEVMRAARNEWLTMSFVPTWDHPREACIR